MHVYSPSPFSNICSNYQEYELQNIVYHNDCQLTGKNPTILCILRKKRKG